MTLPSRGISTVRFTLYRIKWRPKELIKPLNVEILEPYGPNVATAEGKTYQSHVRITAPPFNDHSGVNSLVWRETLYQTRHLSESWAKSAPDNIDVDINSLTLSIISLAGFGRRLEWRNSSDADEDIPAGYRISFLRAINDTVRYMVFILLFPRWLLSVSPWSNAAVAHAELDKYLREIIRGQKKKLSADIDYRDAVSRGNLLTAVVRASILDSRSSEEPTKNLKGFTEDETMGNLFVYLLAGNNPPAVLY